MLILSESDVLRRLDAGRLISALEAAFCDRYSSVTIPQRTHLEIEDGILLLMPCYDRGGRTLGMKTVVVREKDTGGEGRVRASYLLLDLMSGQPRMTAGAKHMTAMRTAATSSLATKYLAREDAKVLGVIGTSTEARIHLEVLQLVRRFERFLVAGRMPKRTQAFAREMSQSLKVEIEAVDAGTCAAGSDVLCTCTNSSTPLFDGGVVRPGTHINAIGAFQPHTRELDSSVVKRSQVVVESYDAALAEAGDLLIPIGEGAIGRDHIVADLHELVTGAKTVRTSANDITLFKSVGNALEDLVAAELIAGIVLNGQGGSAVEETRHD